MISVVEQENRQHHLLKLMRDYGVTNAQIAEMIDRSPETVARYRSGSTNLPDHTLALIELTLRYRYDAAPAKPKRGRPPKRHTPSRNESLTAIASQISYDYRSALDIYNHIAGGHVPGISVDQKR
jgi:hypothetical protein